MTKRREGHDDPPRRITFENGAEKQLCDFDSSKTYYLFQALDISTDFLQTDPTTWESNDKFTRGRLRIKHLKVVNDAAERGVALIQAFNGVLTNQEDQQQFLLQVIEKHREYIPNAEKATIVAGVSRVKTLLF